VIKFLTPNRRTLNRVSVHRLVTAAHLQNPGLFIMLAACLCSAIPHCRWQKHFILLLEVSEMRWCFTALRHVNIRCNSGTRRL